MVYSLRFLVFLFFHCICFVLGFIAWDPDFLLLLVFVCTALAKSWLHFPLEVGSWSCTGRPFDTAWLPLPHFLFLFGWTRIFFPFPVFFTSLDPKVKRALAKLDCIALAEVRDVTLFENLITPQAKLGLSSFGAFEWFVHTSFLRILQNLPWNHSDQCSVFVEQLSSWAVSSLLGCFHTSWCLSNKTIGTIRLWSICLPNITKWSCPYSYSFSTPFFVELHDPIVLH